MINKYTVFGSCYLFCCSKNIQLYSWLNSSEGIWHLSQAFISMEEAFSGKILLKHLHVGAILSHVEAILANLMRGCDNLLASGVVQKWISTNR